MAFDIQKFGSEALGYGLIRPSHFVAAIPTAPAWYKGQTRFLSYLCSSGNLPGSQVITSEERIRGYGPARKVPYDIATTDVTLTFYCDGNGETVAFFDNWIRNVVAHGNPAKTTPLNGASYGEVQYPSHYETVLVMYVYNENPGNGDNPVEILKYTMDRAYPVSMSEVQFDWNNGEAIQTFSVTFTFHTFYLEKNIAAKYGQGQGVARDSGYLARARGQGAFDGQNEFAKYAQEAAKSVNPGFVGLPGIDALVGMVSNLYSTVQDKLNVVNGYASKINGQLQSIGALASLGRSKSNPIKVPQVPTIRFP